MLPPGAGNGGNSRVCVVGLKTVPGEGPLVSELVEHGRDVLPQHPSSQRVPSHSPSVVLGPIDLGG